MDYRAYFKQYKTNRSLLELQKIEEQKIIRELLEMQQPSVKAQVITDMPICHGEDNSSVERFAVQSEQRQQELNLRLKVVQDQVFKLRCDVTEAEACLNVLGSKERFIIEQYYLDDLEWSLVSNTYQCHYKEFKSIKRLIAIRNSALRKIDGLLKK